MKKKRLPRIIALITIAGLIMTSCAGSGSAGPVSPAEVASTQSVSEAEPAETASTQSVSEADSAGQGDTRPASRTDSAESKPPGTIEYE